MHLFSDFMTNNWKDHKYIDMLHLQGGSILIKKLSIAISAYCIQHTIIDSKDEEWLRYGVEKRLSTIVIMFPFFILSLILTDLPSSLSFLIAFKLLRGKANGYHANTVIGCFIVSLFLEFLFLAGLYPMLSCKTALLCNFFSSMAIFILAPYDHPNMGFSEEEKEALRQSSQITVITLSLTSKLCFDLGLFSIANGLTTGIAMAGFSLCLAYINDWRKKI